MNLYILCFRLMMDILNIKKTDIIYIVNGLVLTCLFFVLRIFTIPIFLYHIRCYHGSRDCVSLGYVCRILVILGLMLDTLNVIWARKLFLGAAKILKSKFSVSMNPNTRYENGAHTVQNRNMYSPTQVKLKENWYVCCIYIHWLECNWSQGDWFACLIQWLVNNWKEQLHVTVITSSTRNQIIDKKTLRNIHL